MTPAAYASVLAGVAASRAVMAARLGEISDVGQTEQYIAAAMASFLDRYGPQLSQKIAAYVEPATRKAVEIIKPSVMEALRDYTPTFAAIAGGTIALSVLLGVWISKREYRRATR